MEQDSVWLHQVKSLNKEIPYTPIVAASCRKTIRHTVTEKRKYENAQFGALLNKFLRDNRRSVSAMLYYLEANRNSEKLYNQRFDELKSVATNDRCKAIDIGLAEYRSIEKQLVWREKRRYSNPAYQIECIIRFISPKGRSQSERRCVFYEEQVRMAMEKLELVKETRFCANEEEIRRKHERSRVTPSVRYNVMKRDRFRCCLCGRSAADGVSLEVDHIIPISKGGKTEYDNLQTLCRDCNRGKAAKM